jgi:hypothetical protein
LRGAIWDAFEQSNFGVACPSTRPGAADAARLLNESQDLCIDPGAVPHELLAIDWERWLSRPVLQCTASCLVDVCPSVLPSHIRTWNNLVHFRAYLSHRTNSSITSRLRCGSESDELRFWECHAAAGSAGIAWTAASAMGLRVVGRRSSQMFLRRLLTSAK